MITLLFLFTNCFAQVATDQRLDAFQKAVPPKWKILQNDSELIVRRTDTVWLLADMRTNAPARVGETAEQYVERIQKYGKKIIPYYVFRAETLWSNEKRTLALQHNRSIDETIDRLPKKHNIERLKNNYLSAKGNEYFVPISPKEKEDVLAYQAEKEKLLRQKIKFPTYDTSKLSLFIKQIVGHESELNILWPFEAGEEMTQIDRQLRTVCPSEP